MRHPALPHGHPTPGSARRSRRRSQRRSGLLALCLWTASLLSACGSDPKPEPSDDATAASDTVDDSSGDTSSGSAVNADTWGTATTFPKEQVAAGKGPLKVGVAMRYLDGPVGVSMAGYGGRNDGRHTHWSDKLKGSAGYYGFQSIKVAVLEAGGARMALVKSPLMCSESYLTDAIARHLKETHDLDFKGRVLTMAGHSHHATARYWPLPPSLGGAGADSYDPEVAETIAAKTAEAIAEAWKARQDGEWAYAYQDDWDPKDEVYRDRRGENNPTYGKDPRLDVLAFRAKKDGAPLAVMMHFAIHGTVFGGGNDMLTEDAPGYVEHKFEEHFFAQTGKPVFGMFAQSSGGDASPAGDSLGHPSLPRLERIGEVAAPRILALYNTLTWKSEAEIAVRSQRLELTHARLYRQGPHAKEHGKELENEFGDGYLWGGWQCQGSGVKDGETMQGKPKLCVDIGKLIGLLEAPIPHGEVHQVYLTTARLGDVWMVSVPGEPNWSLVKYARGEAAKRTWQGKPMQLMVMGYSQDHYLYLSAPDDWYLGGYESTMSLWGPLGGLFMVDQGLRLADEMIEGYNGPAFFEESASLSPVPQWTPRKREVSKAAGTVLTQPKAKVARTETVVFSVNCGDPGLGAPRLRVERDEAGTFKPAPARHGWTGRPYDNSRYEIVTAYDPDPPQDDHKSVPERTHTWHFYWQVPSDWPTGKARLHLSCAVVTAAGAAPKTLEIDSTAFEVTGHAGATLTATVAKGKDGDALQAVLRVPGGKLQTTEARKGGKGNWASAYYRLLDRDVKHTDAAKVRAPLKLELLDGAGKVVGSYDAAWDATADAAVAPLPAVGLPVGASRVRAWIPGDATPAKVEVALPAP